MADNIIQFPQNETSFPSSDEEALDQIHFVRQQYCDEVVSDTIDAIISVLNSYGFVARTDAESIKDIVFLEETLKALTYRYKKLAHPLHDIIEQSITLSEEAQKQAQEKFGEPQLT